MPKTQIWIWLSLWVKYNFTGNIRVKGTYKVTYVYKVNIQSVKLRMWNTLKDENHSFFNKLKERITERKKGKLTDWNRLKRYIKPMKCLGLDSKNYKTKLYKPIVETWKLLEYFWWQKLFF